MRTPRLMRAATASWDSLERSPRIADDGRSDTTDDAHAHRTREA